MFWIKCLVSSETECFETFRDLLIENELHLDEGEDKITENVRGLGTTFKNNFRVCLAKITGYIIFQ